MLARLARLSRDQTLLITPGEGVTHGEVMIAPARCHQVGMRNASLIRD